MLASKPLKVAVLADKYQTSFMTPRHSRHSIFRRKFIPLNLASAKLEGITFIPRALGCDVVHSHNRIPLGTRKFIISFESHLPRRFSWPQDNAFTNFMTSIIANSRCRRIVAMSRFAERIFLHQHSESKNLDTLRSKLVVRYPNIEIPQESDNFADHSSNEMVLTFVGAHFARKGGCVAVKIAEKARRQKIPIRVNIISSLEMGRRIWTDPSDDRFFDKYRALLNGDNVNYIRPQPNSVVRRILRESHFSILTTFADTFGFSAIESMAAHTPVIGTRICALPEFIDDGKNGILIDLPTTPTGEWKHPGYWRRHEPLYAKYFADQVELVAESAMKRLRPFLDDAGALASMRKEARRTAERLFSDHDATEFWDNLYGSVACEHVTDPIRPSIAL